MSAALQPASRDNLSNLCLSSLDHPLALYFPEELTALRQWILWRYEQRSDSPKPTKVPYTCMGYKASVTNPSDWSRYEHASKILRELPDFADGIGFVFTPGDPYCGIDLDDCWSSDASEMETWAAVIEQRFSDTYREQSPSKTGLKIWCKAKAPRCSKWPKIKFTGNASVPVH